MKKYLMTWFGLADFKASLGIGHKTGPILGALLSEDYTDIVILGFLQKDKTKYEADYFQQRVQEIDIIDSKTLNQFLDIFLNTNHAHTHYCKWLNEQLQLFGKKSKLDFCPVNLNHLNDTEGIYEAANQSLYSVVASDDEKLITLFLSPGTPVMAFVWAFVALRYPKLKKRLISSSKPGLPPENIVLPNEWLEWHGKQIKSLNPVSERYDVFFHLFGEQRIPNFLGINQFTSKKHIFVNSAQYPAKVMKQFLGEAEYAEINVDAYDPENVRSTILNLIDKMPADIRIGFNLTGGTKLMYAGALAACRKVNATPYYFNCQNNRVINLNDFTSNDTKLIPSVETFIQLNCNNLFISKAGYWSDIPDIKSPERKSLTNELWQVRSKLSKMYRDLSKYNDSYQPFELHKGDIYVKLSIDKSAFISIGKKQYMFKEWPDFAQYLSGKWFEEYIYLKLISLVEEGLIIDIRIGLEVSFKESDNKKGLQSFGEQLRNMFGDTYQELDITFTDGRRLYIIECKAGNVNSEHVMKLQNITRYFGGLEGKAILASCFTPNNKIVQKKIDDSKNLQLVSDKNIFNQIKEIINLRE